MIEGIKYIAPRGNSGYSEAAKDYMIGLHQANIPISWQQMVFDETEHQIGARNQIVNSLLDKDIKFNKVILHTTPEHWPALIKQYKKEGIEIIGMTVWETDKLDDRWVDWINQVDRVLVPCKWNKEVFQKCGIIKPIGAIPHIFKPLPKKTGSIKGIDKDDFIFYTIGQWTSRKGIDDTIRAYLKAFTNKDKTCLVVKAFKSSYAEEEKLVLRNYINGVMKEFKNPAKVIFLSYELTREEIAALHNLGHCYVTLCKAEGWGLGIFDAAGMGNPVVCTGYGGQLDFLKRHLVPYNLVSVEGMSWIPWYNPSQHWAEPKLEEAAKILKTIFNNYKEIKKSFKLDQKLILNNYLLYQTNMQSRIFFLLLSLIIVQPHHYLSLQYNL